MSEPLTRSQMDYIFDRPSVVDEMLELLRASARGRLQRSTQVGRLTQYMDGTRISPQMAVEYVSAGLNVWQLDAVRRYLPQIVAWLETNTEPAR